MLLEEAGTCDLLCPRALPFLRCRCKFSFFCFCFYVRVVFFFKLESGWLPHGTSLVSTPSPCAHYLLLEPAERFCICEGYRGPRIRVQYSSSVAFRTTGCVIELRCPWPRGGFKYLRVLLACGSRVFTGKDPGSGQRGDPSRGITWGKVEM